MSRPQWMDIKHKIAVASDRLSWRLTQQIEGAYSRILEAGRPRHEGTREYRGSTTDSVGDFTFKECTFTTYTTGSDNQWVVTTSYSKFDAEKRKFTRRAIWFWCLLFGHWEYYK